MVNTQTFWAINKKHFKIIQYLVDKHMKQINKIINGTFSRKQILVLFIITNMVYAYMLIVSIPNTMVFSNNMKLLDMMPFGYDAVYVNLLFDQLGTIGRKTYLTTQIPIDMVYPLLFAITYSLLLIYFFNKIVRSHTILKYLSILPIVAGLSDYLENIGIITLLNNYPNHSISMVSTTNIFSIIKSSTTSISFLVILILLLIMGVNSLKKL